mmetsp:Transcript_33118/g.51765  ORF Transcript_33118/g.51765 Transcript_33118/m.51765 type:complete len:302 (-) Transcript_33118:24-929(-)
MGGVTKNHSPESTESTELSDMKTPKKFPVKSSQKDVTPFDSEGCLKDIQKTCNSLQEQLIQVQHELFQMRSELRAASTNPIPVEPVSDLDETEIAEKLSVSSYAHMHTQVNPGSQSDFVSPNHMDMPRNPSASSTVAASEKTPQQDDTTTPMVAEIGNDSPSAKGCRASSFTEDCSSDMTCSDLQSEQLQMSGIFRHSIQKRDRKTKRGLLDSPCSSKYHEKFSQSDLHASSRCHFCSRCHVLEKLFNQDTSDCPFSAHKLSKDRVQRILKDKGNLLQEALKRFEDVSAGVVHEAALFGGI